MKKITSLLMSFLLMLSLTAQAFAAEADLNEEFLSLDEANECLDQVTFPLGYDTIICSRVYYDGKGMVTDSIFTTKGSPDVSEYVTAPYEQRSYYDAELDAVVTERIYDSDRVADYAPSDASQETPDARRVPDARISGEDWFVRHKQEQWTINDSETDYYAEGYFEWDGEDVMVSQADGDYDYFPSNMEIIKDGVSIDYGGLSTAYAKVTYKINYYNGIGKKDSLSVGVKVNAYGKATYS